MSKRVLISVFEKENIVEFASELVKLGWEIISTGGTYKILKESGLDVIEVDEVTNFKEILNGRVKTLHPFIHGGILYKRNDQSHIETVDRLGISSIDMVVNNLYPFEKVLNSKNKTHEDLIENIDIGGPSMIRAAAKNYNDVSIVVDPNDYSEIIERLKEDKLDKEFRLYLSTKAFNYTAYYDALISSYFNDLLNIDFPEKLTMTYKKFNDLRYGENPHQNACFYEKVYVKDDEKTEFKQLHGKELSYNNLTDMYSAIKIVKEFDDPCVVAVKHNNPCGLAISENIDDAYDKAYTCDSISIFGGIIALNREVTKCIAEKINNFFVQKKNIRLIEVGNISDFKLPKTTVKEVLNGIVVQEYDDILLKENLKFVTKRKPTEEELKNLIFGFNACKTVASNGIVIVKDNATIGIGQGEVRRSWAVEEGLERAKENLKDAVLASDAFFFEDTVELLKENGIKAVIQPGGSIKDENVIKLSDEYGIAMVFTSTRHFRH